MKISKEGRVEKGWGHEEILVSTTDYCLKRLVFKETGTCFSMHFHANKREHWLVESGEFQITTIDTTNAQVHTRTLHIGDLWYNKNLVPHRISCISPGVLLEVSTPDDPDDNYRVLPGDSQIG